MQFFHGTQNAKVVDVFAYFLLFTLFGALLLFALGGEMGALILASGWRLLSSSPDLLLPEDSRSAGFRSSEDLPACIIVSKISTHFEMAHGKNI